MDSVLSRAEEEAKESQAVTLSAEELVNKTSACGNVGGICIEISVFLCYSSSSCLTSATRVMPSDVLPVPSGGSRHSSQVCGHMTNRCIIDLTLRLVDTSGMGGQVMLDLSADD